MDFRTQLQLTLGDTLTLERELEGGGMSRVFVARDQQLGRRVVVKTLGDAIGASVSTERFRREIRLAASLQQANIVPVHSAGEVDGVPYYTMPFVEGESLRAHLAASGALEPPAAIHILRDVARALAFAHERGVVHRDIKPENILLSGSTAVVTDFGIAKAIAASHSQASDTTLTQLGTLIGTPTYMSPEQASGDPNVDHRSDLYSLGVVAYEMLAGKRPFSSTTARELLVAHVLEPPPSLAESREGIPPRLAALVMRCLEKDPAHRPQNAAEFLTALDATLATGAATTSAARPVRGSGESTERKSVAILPFANLSPDPENEFFADGITDDVIAQLAKIGALRVIARTSVMRYRGVPDAARTAARELGVGAVVEGTVRRAGKRARIVAQLVDTATDAPIWSETYDRDLDDVFFVQTEVATSVAEALRATLTPDEKKRLAETRSVDATTYDLYLLGRYQYNRRTPDSLRAAITHFEKAIERDPRFVPAYAGLADAYLFAALGYAPIPSAEAFTRANDFAARALALDPASPEALCAMALAAMHGDWDVPRARELYERAVRLNPNHATAHQFLAWCLFSAGDYVGALEPARRALELDPLNVSVIAETGWPFSYAGLHEIARERYRAAIEVDPGFGLAYYNLGTTWQFTGRIAEAMECYERALSLMGRAPWVLASLAKAHIEAGNTAKGEILLDELREQARSGIAVWLSIAQVLDTLGRTDEVFDALDRSIAEHEPFVWAINLEGWIHFPNARRDARFARVLDRLGARKHDVARQRELLLAAHASRP